MSTTKKQNYTLPIIMMFALFFMIAFVTGLQNPLGVIVKDLVNKHYANANANFLSQLGNLMNFLAYACMGIPAGIMLKKIGYKKTALWAIAIGLFGVIVTFLSGIGEFSTGIFIIYLLGAFISGFSMCMLNTVVNPMLNTLGGGGNRGNQLIQGGGVFNSLAATIVPVLGGYLMGANSKSIKDSNAALFLAMGIFALAFIVLALVKIPEPHLKENREAAVSKEKDPHSAWSFRHFVFGIITIFIYVGMEVGIPNIMNLYMNNDSAIQSIILSNQPGVLVSAVAGSIVGVYWLLMLVGRLIGTATGKKVSSKTMLSTVSSIAILLVIAAIFWPKDAVVKMPAFSNMSFSMATVPVSFLLLVLCGLCTSVMWGSIFNLAVEGLGKYTEAASGIFMVMVCGGGILPAIQGLIADKAGYMSSYWLIVAGFVCILLYALVFSKNVNPDIKTE
ncbi:MAG: MFS transporter [Bacteroidales bacterium]|jgi:FHS family L-fucose permease-like MFS transporter|nr:MFS transporter [Bacteroidales bacterium]MCI2122013.1 MFS transporter [Bacteroidales bacterium]MCI2145183.1 MFS transporter [Bacteroidales bacterium]